MSKISVFLFLLYLSKSFMILSSFFYDSFFYFSSIHFQMILFLCIYIEGRGQGIMIRYEIQGKIYMSCLSSLILSKLTLFAEARRKVAKYLIIYLYVKLWNNLVKILPRQPLKHAKIQTTTTNWIILACYKLVYS